MMKKNILYLVPVLLGLFLLSCSKSDDPAPEPLAIDDLIGNFTADYTYTSILPLIIYFAEPVTLGGRTSTVFPLPDAQGRTLAFGLNIPEEDEGAAFSFEKTDDTSGTLTIALEDGPELLLTIEKVRSASSSKKVTFKIDEGELKAGGQTIPLTDIDFDKADADDIFFNQLIASADIPSGTVAAFTQAFNPAGPYQYQRPAETVTDDMGNITSINIGGMVDAGDPPPLPATISYAFQIDFDGIFKDE